VHRFFITLATLFLASIRPTCSAQVLTFALVPGSCIKCTHVLSSLAPAKTAIPSFVILPEYSREDSAEYEEQYAFRKQGFMVLYNTKYFNELIGNSSGRISLLGSSGKVISSTPMLNVSYDTLAAFSRQLTALSTFRAGAYSVFFVDKGLEYELDFTTSRLNMHNGQQKMRLDVPEATLDRLRHSFGSEYGAKNVIDCDARKVDPQFKPCMDGIHAAFAQSPLRTVIKQYLLMKNGADTLARPVYSIAHWTNNQLSGAVPVFDPPASLDMTYNPLYFVQSTDRQKLYMVCYPAKYAGAVKAVTDKRFIGEWRIVGETYRFERLLPNPVPPDHPYPAFQRLSLASADYPYYIIPESRQLGNLVSGEYKPLPVPRVLSRKAKPIYYPVVARDKQQKLYLVYMSGGAAVLQVLRDDTLEVLNTVDLTNMIPDLAQAINFSLNLQENSFYVCQGDGRITGYPLDFFLHG